MTNFQIITLSDGGNQNVITSIRAHANFNVTAPLALIGLFALTMMSAYPIALHIFGAAFFLSHLFQAQDKAAANANGKGRMTGALMTVFTNVGTVVYLFWLIFTFTIS